jgi:hypothetical protein
MMLTCLTRGVKLITRSVCTHINIRIAVRLCQDAISIRKTPRHGSYLSFLS